jgi:hypothetical protein
MEPVCIIDAPTPPAPSHDPVEMVKGLPDPRWSGCVETSSAMARISFEGFDETRVAVAGLVTRVRAAVADSSSLAVLEEGIRQEVLAVGHAAVQDGLNAVSAAEVRRIRDRAARFRCTGTSQQKILAAATYLDNHLDQLDYPTALARGWPIATGVIEGACRNLVCDRMDVTGARWGLPGAQTILDLRALVITDSYTEYWQHHTTRQHARQYPHYTPAAA